MSFFSKERVASGTLQNQHGAAEISSGSVKKSLITRKNKPSSLGKRLHSASPSINTCHYLFQENKALPYSALAQMRARAVPPRAEDIP